MPEHGHDVCPHCDAVLQGSEATCPACSGPLFGIAPKKPAATEIQPENSTVTIDNVAVPTYTPPPSENSGDNESAEDLVQRGEMMSLEGRHSDALALFNQAITKDPSSHMAWFNRGVMSEAMGDVQDAVKSFQTALNLSPGHGAASANLAVILQRMGQTAESAQHAQNGLTAFPGHPALLEIVNSSGGSTPIADIAIEQEVVPEVEDTPEPEEEVDVWAEPQGAVKTLDAHEPVQEVVADVAEIDLDALAESAKNMIRNGDAAGALESLRTHLPDAAAEHALCWRVAAGAMARLDLVDAAIDAFEYALELEQDDASTWFNLGALRKKNQDVVGALTSFQSAFNLDSSYVKAANGLAMAALDLGQIDVAIDGFRALVALEPSHASAIIFAELLIDLAEGEGRVLELDMTIPTTLPAGPEMAREALNYLHESETRLRARAFSLMGEHAASVSLWKALVADDKNDPELWLGLARTLSAAGSEEKAAKCREKARGLGADVAEPEVETQPETIPETIPEPVAEESQEDPWAAFTRPEETDAAEPEPQISTEEIIAHEAALDTIQDPEPISYAPVNEEVDLAAAALEAQSNSMEVHQVLPDSSSVANQDIEWYNKGNELLNKDRYTEALSCFDRALPSFKDDKAMAIKILNGRGNCFYYLNQYKEAIESYYKAFGIDKSLTTGKALYNMGTAYAELGAYKDAIHCFNQYIGKDVGEPLSGENKKRAKEQIRLSKKLLKEQNKR